MNYLKFMANYNHTEWAEGVYKQSIFSMKNGPQKLYKLLSMPSDKAVMIIANSLIVDHGPIYPPEVFITLAKFNYKALVATVRKYETQLAC